LRASYPHIHPFPEYGCGWLSADASGFLAAGLDLSAPGALEPQNDLTDELAARHILQSRLVILERKRAIDDRAQMMHLLRETSWSTRIFRARRL
jgi:hypothetical protein